MSRGWIAALLCCLGLLPGGAAASTMEAIEAEIRLLGASPYDAIHDACRGEEGIAEPPGGSLPSALVGLDDDHELVRRGRPLLRAMRSSAEERAALRRRCVGALEAWRLSREHGGTSADAGVRRPDAVVACLPAMESLQATIADEAARCMQLVRAARWAAAGRPPLLPFGLRAHHSPADFASALDCSEEGVCILSPHEVARRDPGWLGERPDVVVLVFGAREGAEVLVRVGAIDRHPSCERALESLERWKGRLEALVGGRPGTVYESAGFGSICGAPTRMQWIDDFSVVFAAVEEEEGKGFLSSVKISYEPHEGGDEAGEEAGFGDL